MQKLTMKPLATFYTMTCDQIKGVIPGKQQKTVREVGGVDRVSILGLKQSFPPKSSACWQCHCRYIHFMLLWAALLFPCVFQKPMTLIGFIIFKKPHKARRTHFHTAFQMRVPVIQLYELMKFLTVKLSIAEPA